MWLASVLTARVFKASQDVQGQSVIYLLRFLKLPVRFAAGSPLILFWCHGRAIKLARQLHAHSAIHAHKLVTTRRAVENNASSHSQVLGPSASRHSPDPHSPLLSSFVAVEETHGSSEPMCLLFLN